MQGISKTLIGTGITQFSMNAATALNIGLLTDGAPGCGWFAEWARKSGNDPVYAYTFGGIFGGFIYKEVADFETLAEFAQCADDRASVIWQQYLNEVSEAEWRAAEDAFAAQQWDYEARQILWAERGGYAAGIPRPVR